MEAGFGLECVEEFAVEEDGVEFGVEGGLGEAGCPIGEGGCALACDVEFRVHEEECGCAGGAVARCGGDRVEVAFFGGAEEVVIEAVALLADTLDARAGATGSSGE